MHGKSAVPCVFLLAFSTNFKQRHLQVLYIQSDESTDLGEQGRQPAVTTGWDWPWPAGRSVSARGYSSAQRPLKSHAENFVYKVNSVGTSHQEKKKPHGQYYIIQINLLIGDFPVEETLHHA